MAEYELPEFFEWWTGRRKRQICRAEALIRRRIASTLGITDYSRTSRLRPTKPVARAAQYLAYLCNISPRQRSRLSSDTVGGGNATARLSPAGETSMQGEILKDSSSCAGEQWLSKIQKSS
jgi:hypothetical protein